MSFQQEDINEFKIEALEFLEAAEKSLLSLDTGVAFSKVYDVIFRSFHNLKGGSAMMELNELLKHIHELETLFTSLKGAEKITKAQTDFFLKGIDAARLIINDEPFTFDYNFKNLEIEAKKSSSMLDEYFVECEEITERFCKNIELFESSNVSEEQLNSTYRDMHSLKEQRICLALKP